jgi:hypothetical protein
MNFKAGNSSTCLNPSTQEWSQQNHEFEPSLGYIKRPVSKTKSKQEKFSLVLRLRIKLYIY